MPIGRFGGKMTMQRPTEVWLDTIKQLKDSATPNDIHAVNTFVKGCFSHCVWDKLYECGPICGNSLTASMVKIKFWPSQSTQVLNISGTYYAEGNYTASSGFNSWGSAFLDTYIILGDISANGANMHMCMHCQETLIDRAFGVFRQAVFTRHYLNYSNYNAYGWGDSSGGGSAAGCRLIWRDQAGPAYNYCDGAYVNAFTPDGSRPSDFSCTIGVGHGSDDGNRGTTEAWFGFMSKPVGFYSIGLGFSVPQAVDYSNLVNRLQKGLRRYTWNS